jgi:hypothetical protein
LRVEASGIQRANHTDLRRASVDGHDGFQHDSPLNLVPSRIAS